MMTKPAHSASPLSKVPAWPRSSSHSRSSRIRERHMVFSESLLKLDSACRLDDTLTETAGLARNPGASDDNAGAI